MFKKILVPVDLTEKNRIAVTTAHELATGEDGELTLLHVIETIEDVAFSELEDFYQRLEERATHLLDTLLEEADLRGVGIYRRVVYGKRVREIVQFAEEEGTDLIVLGSHPVDRERPGESWSSISYQVAMLAGCPVLLVK